MTLQEYIVQTRPTNPYYVGCDDQSADRVYFTLQDVLRCIDRHRYIAVFDIWGEKLREFKVIGYIDNTTTTDYY